jgi:hypothetical protein
MSELWCRFCFVYLLLFSFSLLRIEFGVIPSSKVDQCLTEWIDNSGGYYFCLKIFVSILFYIIFGTFKVLDIILDFFIHILFVKWKNPNISEKAPYIYFYFYFHFFLEGKYYVVLPYGTVVTGILDMRPGKHDLHFLVGCWVTTTGFCEYPW